MLAALFCTFTPVLERSLRQAMLDVSMHTLGHDWLEMLVRAISAGFLIAVLVWLMPSAEGAEFQMTVVLTYLIAIGGSQHIVAGSMEAFMLLLAGQQRPRADPVWLHHPRSDRQRARRDSAVRGPVLRPGDERDLRRRPMHDGRPTYVELKLADIERLFGGASGESTKTSMKRIRQ